MEARGIADKHDASVSKGLVARRVCRNGKRGRELSAGGEAGFRALFDGNTSEYSTNPYLCQYLTVQYSSSMSWAGAGSAISSKPSPKGLVGSYD
jgi:hypothetical protein